MYPGSVTYSHDNVGNRTFKGTSTIDTTYTWDALNRMTVALLDDGSAVGSQHMAYRPDGLIHRNHDVPNCGST